MNMDISTQAGLEAPPETKWEERWEILKPTIEFWYLDKKLSMAKLAEHMKENYGFNAYPHQYKHYLDKWDFKKNLRGKDKARIAQAVSTRAGLGRATVVERNGRRVDLARVRRHMKNDTREDAQALGLTTEVIQRFVAGTRSTLGGQLFIGSMTSFGGTHGTSPGQAAHVSPLGPFFFRTPSSSGASPAIQRITRNVIPQTSTSDVDTQGGFYGNALQAASEKGEEKKVQMLLDKGADVNARGGFYGNALCAALFGGHENVVQILLDKGADANSRGGFYGNALQTASEMGYEKVVQMLLDKGADVNAQDGRYGNALCASSFRGHEKVVQILLDKGANVNRKGGVYQKTALHMAAEEGHLQVVRLLLAHGVEHRMVDCFGETALHYAAERGYLEIVTSLVYQGSRLDIVDVHKRTPIECARRPLSGRLKGRRITYIIDWLEAYSENQIEVD